jgi:tRNA A37 threonylcarbamoyladenosine dehydratase
VAGSFAAEFWLEQEGAMTIVDVVDITNINRQLPALHSTGQAKIKIVADRLMDINPALKLHR